MSNFIKNTEITPRNYKLWKTLYNYNLLKTLLIKNNLFIFFYDFISPLDNTTLKSISKTQNLKITKIKKKTSLSLLSNPEYKALNNLLTNNVLIITTLDQKKILNKELFTALSNVKSIYLTGIWLNNKLYRPSEYQTLLNLNESIKAKPILLLKQLINTLKISLSLKK
jgi:hypothetical protein